MPLKCKKFLAVLSALFLFFSVAFSPFYVSATASEDYAKEILQNYKAIGIDEDGNAILSEDDYESYMNDVLAYIEKNSAEVSDSETLTKSQTRALTASSSVKASSTSDLVLDEVKEKSRFLDLPIFNNFVVDAVKWMITECLSNPIYAGEELPEESETESETETETETTPPTTTTDTVPAVAGLGSNLQKYTINGNDLYERIDLSFKTKIGSTKDESDVSAIVTRSGLGASASYDLDYDASLNTRNISMTWQSGSYTNATFEFPAGTLYAGYQLSVYRVDYKESNYDRYSGFTPKIYNFSVNQLPVISRSGSTTVTLSSIINGSNAVFAENTFYSNNPTYISNHTINASTNNYWNSYNVSVNNTNSYITSGTTINTTNYNDYSQYGYYIDNSGNLAIDDETLNDYIQNTLLSGLLQGYIDTYNNFPEVGANVDDPDIQYVNPFEDDEPDPTETDSDSGSIQIDYNEILAEGELESILTQETYTVDEIETGIVLQDYAVSLPETESETEIPEVVQAVSNVPALMSEGFNLLESWHLSGLFISLAVIGIIWNKILK